MDRDRVLFNWSNAGPRPSTPEIAGQRTLDRECSATWPPRASLPLVHLRFRHAGPERCQGAVGGTGV